MTKYHHLLPSLSLSLSLVVLFVGFCTTPTHANAAAGTGPASLVEDNNNEATTRTTIVTCSSGWTGADSPQVAIPNAWINDGYCDCPFDGKDEPNTNACSGSATWPGVDTGGTNSASSIMETATATATSSLIIPVTTTFVCPQQPGLVLPLSRLNDGICDCCDGKDEERNVICPDNCEEFLKVERERLAKLTHDYRIGSRKREIDLIHFSEMRTSKLAEVSTLGRQLNSCSIDINLIVNTKIVELKQHYVQSRMAAMKDGVVANPMATELLNGLDNTELEALIVHLCQISGELISSIAKTAGNSSDDDDDDDEQAAAVAAAAMVAVDDDTCSALRVAALDLGLTWNDQEDFDNFENTMKGEVNMTREMIQTIFNNAIMDAAASDSTSASENDNDSYSSPALPSLRWRTSSSSSSKSKKRSSSSSSKGRRRLDEINDDEGDFPLYDDDHMTGNDDMYNGRNMDYDDDDDDDLGNRDRDRNEERSRSRYNNNNNNRDNNNNNKNNDEDFVVKDAQGKEKEFVDIIQNSLFSKTRATFLTQSQEILDEITKILASSPPSIVNNDTGGYEHEPVDDDELWEDLMMHDKSNDEKKVKGKGEKGTNDISDSNGVYGGGDKQADDSNSNSNNNKEEATTTTPDDDTGRAPTGAEIDPAAYTMLRNNLRRKQAVIKKGLRWGASAKLLFAFSSLRESNDNLKRLAVGTIFYGQISAVHVWQILQAILPEYNMVSSSSSSKGSSDHEEEDGTCASPWANHCPPKHIYRESISGKTEYPSSILLDVAKSFCDEEALNFGKNDGSSASACKNNALGAASDDISKDIIMASVTTSQDGGYFGGYTVPVRRNADTDPLQPIFAPIIALPVDAEGLRSLEDEKKSKEEEKKELTNSINDIWNQVGGKDGTELGRDGELHTIADKCFDILAGKYTYEVCLFGKALQKEGANSKSGTNLGHWKGIEYYDSDNDNDNDETNGITRVLKWENGSKCWNGPKRSATVYMKCGVDHKIISADEPDTCRYVFEMESYLACDDAYKLRAGL